MDNIQLIADAVQKGFQLIVREIVQQGSTRLRRLRIELCTECYFDAKCCIWGSANLQ